jgi:hypothetical protein
MEPLCMTHFNALPNFKQFIQFKWLIISLWLSYKLFFLLNITEKVTIYHYWLPYKHYGKYRIIERISIMYLPVPSYIFCSFHFWVGYYILKNVPAIYDAGSIFQFATSHNTSTIYHYRVPYNIFFPILFCVGYYILKNVPAIYDAGSIFQFATSHNTSTIYHYRVPYTHFGKFRIIEYITIIYLPVRPYIFLPILFA